MDKILAEELVRDQRAETCARKRRGRSAGSRNRLVADVHQNVDIRVDVADFAAVPWES